MSTKTILVSESKRSAQLVVQALANSDYELVFEAANLTELMAAQINDVELIILCINVFRSNLLLSFLDDLCI